MTSDLIASSGYLADFLSAESGVLFYFATASTQRRLTLKVYRRVNQIFVVIFKVVQLESPQSISLW